MLQRTTDRRCTSDTSAPKKASIVKIFLLVFDRLDHLSHYSFQLPVAAFVLCLYWLSFV